MLVFTEVKKSSEGMHDDCEKDIFKSSVWDILILRIPRHIQMEK